MHAKISCFAVHVGYEHVHMCVKLECGLCIYYKCTAYRHMSTYNTQHDTINMGIINIKAVVWYSNNIGLYIHVYAWHAYTGLCIVQ